MLQLKLWNRGWEEKVPFTSKVGNFALYNHSTIHVNTHPHFGSDSWFFCSRCTVVPGICSNPLMSQSTSCTWRQASGHIYGVETITVRLPQWVCKVFRFRFFFLSHLSSWELEDSDKWEVLNTKYRNASYTTTCPKAKTYLKSSFLINSTMMSFSGWICSIFRVRHRNGVGLIFPP